MKLTVRIHIEYIIVVVLLAILPSCKLNKSYNNPEAISTKEVLDEPTALLLDSIISITKDHSIYGEGVDFDELKHEMYRIALKSDSIDRIGKPVEYLLAEIGDYHGFIMHNYKTGFSPPKLIQRPVRDSTYEAIAKTKILETYLPNTFFYEEHNIAYIELPGTGYMDDLKINEAIDTIVNKICELNDKAPTGWIIDLRTNIGGNMNPLMSALGNLIGNEIIGGSTKDGKSFTSNGKYVDGEYYEYLGSKSKYSRIAECLKDRSYKIAVLGSRYTVSAGEYVASSLKGVDNIKLFGEKTGGLSTTNGWFVLDSNWVYIPAIAYYMSIDSTVHKDGIIPDVIIESPLDIQQLTSGPVIEEAIKWMKVQ